MSDKEEILEGLEELITTMRASNSEYAEEQLTYARDNIQEGNWESARENIRNVITGGSPYADQLSKYNANKVEEIYDDVNEFIGDY